MLKSREIEVPEENPFCNDELNRKESADALTEFVVSANEPLVLCIDAPWGQGKTTFLRMWQQSLKNSEVPTIYFNAWENDFSENALVSLIGEISSALSELAKTGDESKAKEYFSKAKAISTMLLKRSIPVTAKMATAGALDLDDLTENALSEFAESIAKEQIDQYEKSKQSLISFRQALTDFASSVTDANDKKPLVFIIDELDRCRPNYSIEVLEKAKHFFNVQNIVFVLGADKSQLGSSIKAIYGAGLNVNGYLRRFIDFDYLLPPPDKGEFVKALFKKYSFSDYFSKKSGRGVQYEYEHALKMFEELFDVFNLTLREQEHCCSLLNLAIRTTPHDYKLFPLFLCFLIVLKVKQPDLYNDLISERISPTVLLEEFSKTPGSIALLETNYGAALEAYIIVCKSHRHGHDDILTPYTKIAESDNATVEQKRRANRILELVEDFDFNGGVGILSYLVNKIEVASRFK
ncbi:P-loop NTPase fold protein [uncultured Marinobacter sp.]|uniref:KAP family P-loop NTPase fold protein n=1 Tax=uncultured Marinobacter sp. TaxID=187379 RepID=UPI0025FC07E1|nr:P-loop NTPase fold protein [uncultured Marinobacter sp.]